MFGTVDFGWQPFEKVFATEGNRIVLKKLKPLLHDITDIMIDAGTGAFMGFRQDPPQGTAINLDLENSLLAAARVEGTNWYGRSLMENVRLVAQMWTESNIGARRYDKKVAGSHFVVYYPVGTGHINGVEKANYLIATELLDALEGSGSITIPLTVSNLVEKLDQEAGSLSWRIEILEDKSTGGGRQEGFITRLKYLDSLLVRALIMPERAILEGQFGTKAEAGAHQDLALTYLEMQHRNITRIMNWHGADQLLVLNFGEKARGRVFLEPSPLADEAMGFVREIYKKLLDNPAGFVQEYETLDTGALKESVGLPVQEDVEGGMLRGVVLPGMETDELRRVNEVAGPPIGANGGGR